MPLGGSTVMVEDYRVHLSITSEIKQQVSEEDSRDTGKMWDMGVGEIHPPSRHRTDFALMLSMAGGL